MSLIECWECGGQVSDHAVLCPHCGAPQGPAVSPPRRSGWRWLRRLIFIIGLAAVFVVVARRQGWVDDESIVRVRAAMPSDWGSGLCEPLRRWTKSGDEVA